MAYKNIAKFKATIYEYGELDEGFVMRTCFSRVGKKPLNNETILRPDDLMCEGFIDHLFEKLKAEFKEMHKSQEVKT